MSGPRYIHGIPVRTIGGEDIEDQQEDFLEESEGRRGIYTAMTDGFTYRQGTDVISHMDKRGGFHPRRYVIQFYIGFSSDDENTYQV